MPYRTVSSLSQLYIYVNDTTPWSLRVLSTSATPVRLFFLLVLDCALEVDTVLLLPRNESRRRCLVFLHACTVITDGSPDLLVLFVEAAAQEPKAHEACRI